MKVVVVYVIGLVHEANEFYVKRFTDSYKKYSASYSHRLVVVVNAGEITDHIRDCFEDIECSIVQHDNNGWDIGTYRKIAMEMGEEMLLGCGITIHFNKEGWLKRMMEVANRFGPGLYGALATHQCFPHIRTNGFLVHKCIIDSYPHPTETKDERYNFEHGAESLTWWCGQCGRIPLLITWDGFYEQDQWENASNVYRHGDQSNLIMRCRLCDYYDYCIRNGLPEIYAWQLPVASMPYL